MNRREWLAGAAVLPLAPLVWRNVATPASAATALADAPFRRVRPSDPQWPEAAAWDDLNQKVGGRLIKVRPLFADCDGVADSAGCQAVLRNLRNPYFVGDQPAATQSVGWVDAWMSKPSAYAVAAKTSSDVAAAVTFARERKLRLVVKGGGHSYQGTSDAPDSLLIWTRAMSDIVVREDFVADGCAGNQAPQPAVTVGAGAVWMHVYDAVTTKGGRYVQGGGCATVGVAGLIQSGGFGSFSKNFGLAAAGLLEAEVVTADGQVRIANACTNPELFWGLKGGGGGSLGVVTRLTLRLRELPALFGGVDVTIKAASDDAFRRLIARFVGFYAQSLRNPHWGESVAFDKDNSLVVRMVFQGLDQREAERVWAPLKDWVAASPQDFSIAAPLKIGAMPAKDWWNAEFIKENRHGRGFLDPRPNAPADNMWFAEQNTELGAFIHGFESLWLPDALLQGGRQSQFAEGLFDATRHWPVALHFNKGFAGANAAEIAAARDTATNPAVLDAFALAIIAGGEAAAYAKLLGGPADLTKARQDGFEVAAAAAELRKLAPDAGAYVSESNFFENNWSRAFWGDNYPRLSAVKQTYDPEGLFFVQHGVGSEDWSDDGFTRTK